MKSTKSLGDYLAAERRRRGLTARQLASLAGYRQLGKGERRIGRFEQTGREVRPFVERLFTAMGLLLHAVERQLEDRAVERNERLLARWLRRHGGDPSPEVMVVRCFAGCYARRSLRAKVTSVREAVTVARSFARSWSHQVALPVGRERHVLFDESGRVVSLRRS